MWPLRKLPEARETGVYPFGRSKGLPELPELPELPKLPELQKKRTPELRKSAQCIIFGIRYCDAVPYNALCEVAWAQAAEPHPQ